MVDFGKTKYFNAMDNPVTGPLEQIHVSQLGASAGFGDVLDSVKGELTAGASHVELVFTGMGKGSLGGQKTTPEMFGKIKRDEIRQLAKINDASVSTHASIGISGVAGFDQRQNKFSDSAALETLHEIKRTVDFAADAAGGGAIVVHTNEFPREVNDERFDFGKEKKEVVYLADPKTGQVYGIDIGQEIDVPKWKMDKDGKNFVDKEGNVIKPTDYLKRDLDLDDKGNIQWTKSDFQKTKAEIEAWNKIAKKEDKLDPLEEHVFRQQYQRLEAEQPRVSEYHREFESLQKLSGEARDKVKTWEQIEANTDPKKLDRLRDDFVKEEAAKYGRLLHGADIENMKPSEILKEIEDKAKEESLKYREGWLGFEKQIKGLETLKENIKSITEVGVEKSANTFAEAAIYALDLEKQKKLDKELYIAPENMMSDWGYGAHPDELKDLIQKSRKKMAELLIERKGMSKKEARKVAASHIKATFDIAHANTWARFFKEDQNLTPEQNKAKFNKWLLDKSKELMDGPEPIIGHVHVSDNFGYFDEHLTVGDGNTPINQFLKLLKDKDYEGKIIVERGAQKQDESPSATLGAWARIAGSPVYRVEGGVSPKWSDIEHSGYFGTASSPNMVVGRYGASLGKDWNMWTYSEAPIE